MKYNKLFKNLKQISENKKDNFLQKAFENFRMEKLKISFDDEENINLNQNMNNKNNKE